MNVHTNRHTNGHMNEHKNKTMRFFAVISIAALLFTTFGQALPGAGFTQIAQAGTSNANDTRSRLGVNLEGLSDWSSSKMFTDAMKTCRVWGTVNAPWTALPADQLDSLGWPTVDCGVVVICSGNTDPGTYKLSFESKGTSLSITPSACNFTTANIKYGPNDTVTADIIVPDGQDQLMMQFKNTNGGVRNVKLLRPGYTEADGLFTKPFLDMIEPFSTLRFMDYLSTNSQNSSSVEPWYKSTQIDWSDRKLPTHASQAASFGDAIGGCWEYLVALLNQTGKDGWINIPYNASDNYLTNLAQFLKDNLDDNIHVYVELSNEVWNWSFAQAQLNLSLANKDSSANSYILQYGKQSTNVAIKFREVYGQAAMNDKIRCVLAWQIGWNPPDGQPREMLNYINNNYEAPSNLFYAIAGAPYFSEPKPEDCTSIEAIHAFMKQSSDESVTGKNQFIKAAKDWNLPGGALCYEGGPHHQGQVETNLDIRLSAQRNAGMKQLVVDNLQKNWFDLGGGLFCYFSLCGGYGKYGCWGLTEKITDDTTPKYQAILQLYNENKTYTLPTVAPTPTPISTVALTVAPTVTPTVAPTATPTTTSTVAPTVAPTATPTATPSATPTMTPNATQYVSPSVSPYATSTSGQSTTTTPSASLPSTSSSPSPFPSTKPVVISVRFKASKVTLKLKKKRTLKVSLRNAKRVDFRVEKSKIIKIVKRAKTSVVVLGRKKGKSKLFAVVGRKKAVCRITVK